MKNGVALLIFGGLLVVAVAATGYFFILLPHEPVINGWALNPSCLPTINFTDKDGGESGFRISFRPQGAQNFTLLKVLPFMSGTGLKATVSLPPPIPVGTYEYKVAAFNSYGQAFDSVTVDAPAPTCSSVVALPTGNPMPIMVSPLVTNVSLLNGCDIKVEFVDFNTPKQLQEDGLRVYRLPNGTNGIVVADLPPADSGSYVDANLPAGAYQYMVSAYKGNNEAYSSYSLSLQTDDSCTPPTVLQLPSTPLPPDPLGTPKKLSCEWEAAANVFLRKGPDVGLYEKQVDVQAGQSFPIVGQSEDGQFWAVEVGPGVIGYITKSEKYSRTNGDCSSVPTLKDPPPPVIEAAPTKKQGGNNNGEPDTATPCPVGYVCP